MFGALSDGVCSSLICSQIGTISSQVPSFNHIIFYSVGFIPCKINHVIPSNGFFFGAIELVSKSASLLKMDAKSS